MTFAVISRADAEASGSQTFFTGVACNHGHVSNRFVSNGKCCECVRDRNKATYAKGGVTQSRARYARYRVSITERKKAQRRARGLLKSGPKPWLSDDDKKKNRQNWLTLNKDKMKEYFKAHYDTNKAAKLAYAKAYRERNPELCRKVKRAVEATRRARKRKLLGQHTHHDLTDIRKRQKNRCAGCKCVLDDSFHADHIVPIAKGGSNFRRNIQLLCAKCNSSRKATKTLSNGRGGRGACYNAPCSLSSSVGWR